MLFVSSSSAWALHRVAAPRVGRDACCLPARDVEAVGLGIENTRPVIAHLALVARMIGQARAPRDRARLDGLAASGRQAHRHGQQSCSLRSRPASAPWPRSARHLDGDADRAARRSKRNGTLLSDFVELGEARAGRSRPSAGRRQHRFLVVPAQARPRSLCSTALVDRGDRCRRRRLLRHARRGWKRRRAAIRKAVLVVRIIGYPSVRCRFSFSAHALPAPS